MSNIGFIIVIGIVFMILTAMCTSLRDERGHVKAISGRSCVILGAILSLVISLGVGKLVAVNCLGTDPNVIMVIGAYVLGAVVVSGMVPVTFSAFMFVAYWRRRSVLADIDEELTDDAIADLEVSWLTNCAQSMQHHLRRKANLRRSDQAKIISTVKKAPVPDESYGEVIYFATRYVLHIHDVVTALQRHRCPFRGCKMTVRVPAHQVTQVMTSSEKGRSIDRVS